MPLPVEEKVYALDENRKFYIYDQILHPGKKQYYDQIVLLIQKRLKVDLFIQSLQRIIRANSALRTVFRWKELPEPVRVIRENCLPPIVYVEMMGAADKKIDKYLDSIWEENLSLEEKPLVFYLIQAKPESYYFVIKYHHILYDGWSSMLLIQSIIHTYLHAEKYGLDRGEEKASPQAEALPDHFTAPPDMKKVQFWKNYFKGFTPHSHPCPKAQQSSQIEFSADQALVCEIRQYLKNRKRPLSSLMLTAWALLEKNYFGVNDICIGLTFSGREKQVDRIYEIGYFIKTLPLRMCPPQNSQYDLWMKKLEGNILDIMENSDVDIIRDIYSSRFSENPYDRVIVIQNYFQQIAVQGGSLHMSLYEHRYQNDLPFCFSVRYYWDTLFFDYSYNPFLYDHPTIYSIHENFLKELKNILISVPSV